ncbi:MAG: 2-isopropylmalate synthase, partial [Burkholderiaceae bacterium]
AFARFKELADRKSEIFDEDILALVAEDEHERSHEHYRLVSLEQRSSFGHGAPHARVQFMDGETEVTMESSGNGPVDAIFQAIEAKVKSGAEMLLYSVNAISERSSDSQGEVTVRLQHGGRVVNGVGADPDIVVASAKAYIAALNKLRAPTAEVVAQG